MSENAHMVEQVIKYSDGTEKVISYRGVVIDGVVTLDTPEESSPSEEVAPEVVEETTEVTEEITN